MISLNNLNFKKIPLRGKYINLRKITKNDLHLLQRWRNSKEIWPYNTQHILLNMINQQEWFDQINSKESDRIMFVVTNKLNKPIGVCGLIHLDLKNKNCATAIIIGEQSYHNKGFGTEILRMLVDYGFNEIKLHRIEAEIFEYNHISVNLFKKMNFRQEAILRDSLWRQGKWWNIYKLSILRSEYTKK